MENLSKIMKFLNDGGYLFLMLFFSGTLFGVVAQRIIDSKPIKPIIKRIAVAGITDSLVLFINYVFLKFDEPLLHIISPIVGFFGEAIVEAMNMKRTGIATGILELILERLGFVKKGGDGNANVS